MTRKQKWTLAEQAMLAAMSDQGMSARRIAHEIGETKDAVASAMTYYGLFSRPKRKPQNISLATIEPMGHA